MNTTPLLILIGTIPTITLVIVGALYGYGQFRRGKTQDDISDAQRWEQAIKLRETEISDLQKQIDNMTTLHKQQIADIQLKHAEITTTLQAQITTLNTQVASLIAEKKVLAETVTGKDILEKISESQVLIQQTLSKFEILLAADGLLATFKKNDDDMLSGIIDIKKALNVGKREKDAKQ